jgi:hypothetical protein
VAVVNTYDDTLWNDYVARAGAEVAEEASILGIDLRHGDATSLARAALATSTSVLVIEDEISAGAWRIEETRHAVRRRLRDRAAITALDEGNTLATGPRERVDGVGPAGETIPVDEADLALITHTYCVRPLGTAPEHDPGREDDASRAGGATGAPSLRLL